MSADRPARQRFGGHRPPLQVKRKKFWPQRDSGGTFANLPDGSTVTAARNNFQVSGDGNDLNLTVVPPSL